MTGSVGAKKVNVLISRGVAAVFLVFFVVAFVGCEDRPTRDAINQHVEQSQQSLGKVMTEVPAKHYDPLVVTDRVWAGNTALRMQRGLPLPPRYETSRGITLVSSDPMSLADIANAITVQTGISVRVTQQGNASGGGAAAAASGGAMPVAYEGPLSGLMEKVAGYFGINWRYDGATISVSRFETRVFTIEALPGTLKSDSGMQGSSSGSSGSSASGGASSSGGSTQQSSLMQSTKGTIDIKYWDELGQIVTSMLGGTGTVVVSQSLGTITVTTTPDIMRTVAEYIAQQNQRLSRQIAINVEVYSVTLSDSMDFNIAFTAVLKKLTSLATGFTGVTPPAPSTVTGGVAGGGVLNVAIINPSGIGTITDVFTALSVIGNTTQVARFPLITLNNVPVSRRIGQSVSYVANSSTTISGTVGASSTALTPGQIQEGFTVVMTPRILDDGRVLLDYSLDIINLVQILNFNSQCASGTTGCTSGAGSTSVQLPDTAERAFTQQTVLKSGSTLIMGGAEEEDLGQNSQGVGSPYNYLLGGGVSSSKSHTMVFFAVTPQVLDVPHTEQE